MSHPQHHDYQLEQRSLTLTLCILEDGTRWAGLYSRPRNKWAPATLLMSAAADAIRCDLYERRREWILLVGTAHFRIPAKHVDSIAEKFGIRATKIEEAA